MSKILVDTIDTRSGTSNMTIGSSNTSQITLKSGATLTNFPNNTPAFFAKLSGNQTIAHNTQTVVAFNTEVYDTNSAFDTSAYKFTVPSGEAGKYIFTATAGYSNASQGVGARYQLMFNKNGSTEDFAGDWAQASDASADPTFNFTTQMNLSVNDYVQVTVYHNTGSDRTLQSAWARFFGYRIIGA